MLEQQVLDIEYRHVLAAANDNVLDTAVDANIALVVHIGHIAGIKPALGVERLHLLALVVAEAHLRAAYLEQSLLADRRRRSIHAKHLHGDALERTTVRLRGF